MTRTCPLSYPCHTFVIPRNLSPVLTEPTEITFKGVCDYILYWAMEDGKVADQDSLCEGNELQPGDQRRIKRVLETIVTDGRIAVVSGNETFYKKK